VDTVLNAYFIEKACLLILGALLTGIVVPIIKLRVDRNWFREQKTFEAEVSRQAEIVKARAAFLKDLSEPVWQFQLLALQIVHNAILKIDQDKAFETYEQQAWPYITKIRTVIGGARWFTSPAAYGMLTEFVDVFLFGEVDGWVRSLWDGLGDSYPSSLYDRLFTESRTRTDALLVALAQDFSLAPNIVTFAVHADACASA